MTKMKGRFNWLFMAVVTVERTQQSSVLPPGDPGGWLPLRLQRVVSKASEGPLHLQLFRLWLPDAASQTPPLPSEQLAEDTLAALAPRSLPCSLCSQTAQQPVWPVWLGPL